MHLVEKITWSEAPASAAYYAACSCVDHLLFCGLGLLLLLCLSRVSKRPFQFLVRRWFLFNVALFVSGAFTGVLWDVLVYGRLYLTADYLSDFSPFVPVSAATVFAHFDGYSGELLGIPFSTVTLFWCAFA